MSKAKLANFLQKLDTELQGSSKKYRRQTANKLLHNFTYDEDTIIKSLTTLIQKRDFQDLFNAKDKKQKQQAVEYIESLREKLQPALTTLTTGIKNDFNAQAVKYNSADSRTTDYIKVTKFFNKGISVTVFESEGSSRDNFRQIQSIYKDHIDKFYQEFLKIIVNPIKLKRTTKKGKSVTSVIDTAGKAFNLEHDQQSSNVESFINDKIYEALGSQYSNKDIQGLNKELANLKVADGRGKKGILNISKNNKTSQINVFLGSAILNNIESSREQAFKRDLQIALKNALEKLGGPDGANLANLKGSDSLLEVKRKRTIDVVTKPFKRIKGAKVKKESTKIQEGITKESLNRIGKAVAQKAKRTSSLKGKKNIKSTRAQKGVSSTPLYLIGIMNEQLPRVIQKNMDAPALENRTGRFASSVRVTDVVMTAGGFPSIGYTYMKSPYQTFEPGFRQGSVERDPRRLIDKSMREIAAQYAIGRFYTRRV